VTGVPRAAYIEHPVMVKSVPAILVLATATLLTGASCGGSQSPTVHSGAGRLQVKQTVDLTGPIPIEGAYSYVRVESEGDDEVVEERLPGDGTATISLDPGSYRMISYQRTCDPSCGNLDAASDRCAKAFTLKEGEATSASVRVTYGSGCTIRFAPA
jgi:hypothetical protein